MIVRPLEKAMISSLEVAKKVLSENTEVPYGIFGRISCSGYFPPRDLLNEFLIHGSDPCDQDGRMDRWTPFLLSTEDYFILKKWWITNHPDTVEDSLGVDCWNDWVLEILNF